MAFIEFSQHSHYNFLKVDYKINFIPKQIKIERGVLKLLALSAEKWILRLRGLSAIRFSNSNIVTKDTDSPLKLPRHLE